MDFVFIAEYGALIIARPNETPVDPCEPDLYQIRQCIYWRSTGLIVVGLVSDADLAGG